MYPHLLLASYFDELLGAVQKIIAGGVPLILAVLAVAAVWFAYRQLRANNDLEQDFREKIEALLREMLGRDREAQETTQAAVQVVQGFASTMKDQRESCDQVNVLAKRTGKSVDEMHKDLERLIVALGAHADRLKSLEEAIRRRRA